MSFYPQQGANKFNLSVKIRPVTHTIDELENLLELASNIEQILNVAKIKLNPNKLRRF